MPYRGNNRVVREIPKNQECMKRILKNPRQLGRGLVGNKAGLWRYRIQDYRIICRLEDKRLVVLVVAVGHRKEIY